jgi:hypothetical protein
MAGLRPSCAASADRGVPDLWERMAHDGTGFLMRKEMKAEQIFPTE